MIEQATRKRKVGVIARARALRHGDNIAEAVIWNALKNRQLGGYKFVRQLPIGPYFADFCCRELGLVVELDGSQHADSPRDRVRDTFMAESGFSVLRFWSSDAVKHSGEVCATILVALEGRLEETVASDLRFVRARRKGDQR